MDRHSIPQLDMIQRIFNGFNITLAEFFADNDAEYEELSKDDLLFLHISRNLNANSRDRALSYMQALQDMQQNE